MIVVTCKLLIYALQEERVDIIPGLVLAKHTKVTLRFLADCPLTSVAPTFEVRGEQEVEIEILPEPIFACTNISTTVEELQYFIFSR